jgi:hypothetical protein
LTTQERLSREKCSAAPIEGSATLTIEASITITNCVIASSISARFFSRGVSRLIGSVSPAVESLSAVARGDAVWPAASVSFIAGSG